MYRLFPFCASAGRRAAAVTRLRDPVTGAFVSKTPYPPDHIPVRRLTLPSTVPFFREPPTDGNSWSEEEVLPAVWKAMLPGGVPKLWKRSQDPASQVQACLDRLASCLYPRAAARWRQVILQDGTHAAEAVPIVPIGDAFCMPLAKAASANLPECMWLDPVRVEATAAVMTHQSGGGIKSGYTLIKLCNRRRGAATAGRRPGGGSVFEFAHRFIHWATMGPPKPPLTWQTAVLIHEQCEDASCCNPMHMRWGTQADNLVPVMLARSEPGPRREHSDQARTAEEGTGGPASPIMATPQQPGGRKQRRRINS